MSDLMANNSHSFGSTNTGKVPSQNTTLPKSQPVRLLYLCESDDDEDDDESEEKPRESEDLSDLDEPSDSAEDVLSDSCIYEAADINSSIGLTDKLSKTILSKNVSATATDISSVQKISCTNSNKECENDVNSESHLLVDDPNKLRTYNSKQEEKSRDYHGCTLTSSRSQSGVTHNCSIELGLSLPLSFYKENSLYIAKSDTSKNLQLTMNSAHSHHENVYISDMLNKKKEEHSYNTSTDNKLLHRNSEHLNLSKERQRYKKMLYDFTEQANKNCNEEPRKIPTVVSESADCISQNLSGNLLHPVTYNNSQYSVCKYEANEKCTPAKNPCTHVELSTPSLNEVQGTSLPTPINRLVLETPLKHLQVGLMHPNPCISHKQLFRTPQNKLSDNLSKNCIQTPSTILSSWCYNNARHTPLEGKNLIAKDHMQISRNTVCTPIVEKPDSGRFVESFLQPCVSKEAPYLT